MRIQVIRCDKCNCDIHEGNNQVLGLDLCGDCFCLMQDVISQWLQEEPGVPDQEESKEEKKSKSAKVGRSSRNKIDWDMACALKLAGRSNKWIADDMGINEGTVNATIYKKLEIYKKERGIA